MATGASTADAAVMLVDAARGVQVQTRRHAHIVSLLGMQHVIVAVNKMDRIGYDARSSRASPPSSWPTPTSWASTASKSIPVGALHGVNVVARGTKETPWYKGRTLLEVLEGIEVARDRRPRRNCACRCST